MQENIQKYAQILIGRHGDKAQAEAARKALELEKKGEQQEAQLWRSVQAAINERRGPHAS